MLKHRGSGLGWVLVIVGALWLASDLGWLPENLPIFPIFLILLGIMFLAKRE